MGKRGPKPLPNETLKIQGSWRANRPGLPQVKPGKPKCPTWLDGTAKRLFPRIVKILFARNVLTEADQMVVAGYCQNYSLWRLAVRASRDRKVKIGTIEHRRITTTAHEAFTDMMKAGAELGLTPSSRPNVTVLSDADQNEKQNKTRFFRSSQTA